MNTKLIPFLALITLLLTPQQVFADKGGIPNEQAYKHANENAAFKRGHQDKDKDWKKDKHKKNDNHQKKDKDKDKDKKDKDKQKDR